MGPYIVFALAVIFLAPSIKILRAYERMAVFRLGRFFRVVGPGVLFLLPVIDKGVRVNLEENISGWRALSKAELDQRVAALVLGKGEAGSAPGGRVP